MTDELLTPQEHDFIRKAGELWNDLCQIVGDGPTRDADLAELITHVHALQRAVMGQAAARYFSETYRLLGQQLGEPGPNAGDLCMCGHHRYRHKPTCSGTRALTDANPGLTYACACERFRKS